MKGIVIAVLTGVIALAILGGGWNSFVHDVQKGVEKVGEGEPVIDAVEKGQEIMQGSLITCKGDALCFEGKVNDVTDGDTLEINGKTIRLALTSAPEIFDEGGEEAALFLSNMCPIGTTALVDEDDGQTSGSYGRIIGLVYCDGILVNEEILVNQHGKIDERFCSRSEFSSEEWVTEYGCKF